MIVVLLPGMIFFTLAHPEKPGQWIGFVKPTKKHQHKPDCMLPCVSGLFHPILLF